MWVALSLEKKIKGTVSLRFQYISYQNTSSKKLQAKQCSLSWGIQSQKGKTFRLNWDRLKASLLGLQLSVAPEAGFAPLSSVLFFSKVKSWHAGEKEGKKKKQQL